MEQVLGAISSVPVDGDLGELKAFLVKNVRLIESNANNITAILGALQPDVNTFGACFLLATSLRVNTFPTTFDSVVRKLITEGDTSQIREGPSYFVAIVEKWVEVYLDPANGANPLSIVRLLQRALEKARPAPDTLTTIHTLLLHVALRAHAYHVGAAVCDETIFDVDEEGCDARNMMLYFYYGGLVYVGLKRWADALRFFRRVVTAPVTELSQIAAEAFKKMLLVSLIETGKFSSDLPRFTSTAVVRAQKQQPFEKYHELATAYQTRSISELDTVAARHAEVWKDDLNIGLVKQVRQSLYRGNIRRHTQTYLTMSLDDLAQSADVPSAQAQAHLLDMIEKRQINAKINQKDNTVAFLEKTHTYDDAEALRLLHQRLGRALQLGARVGELRDTIETSQKTSPVTPQSPEIVVPSYRRPVVVNADHIFCLVGLVLAFTLRFCLSAGERMVSREEAEARLDDLLGRGAVGSADAGPADSTSPEVFGEESLREVMECLTAVPGNDRCVECSEAGPQWGSATLGVFLCIQCSGIHRQLGVHLSRVKSINLDNWKREELQTMRSVGNARAADNWEANLPPYYQKPSPTDSVPYREQFVRAKYEQRLFQSKERGGNAPQGSSADGASGSDANGVEVWWPTRAGFLTKKGAVVKSWKRRWFVLNGTLLSYFKKPKDVEPAGSIQLATPTVRIDCAETPIDGRQSCFEITTESRVFAIAADNMAECFEWTQDLRRARALLCRHLDDESPSLRASVEDAEPDDAAGSEFTAIMPFSELSSLLSQTLDPQKRKLASTKKVYPGSFFGTAAVDRILWCLELHRRRKMAQVPSGGLQRVTQPIAFRSEAVDVFGRLLDEGYAQAVVPGSGAEDSILMLFQMLKTGS